MLNRKASNLIFYGSLLGITVIVVIIRFAMLGALDSKIEAVEADSRYTQFLIDQVDEVVSENRGIQQDHLYELYNKVPEMFKDDILVNYVEAKLELVGVTAATIVDRDVDLETDPTFPSDSVFRDIQDDYQIVEVIVTFNTQDDPLTEDVNEASEQIEDFIDAIHESEQVFIISYVKFNDPDGGTNILVEINFLTFYKK